MGRAGSAKYRVQAQEIVNGAMNARVKGETSASNVLQGSQLEKGVNRLRA